MSPLPPDVAALLAALPEDEADRLREMWRLVPASAPGADGLPSPDEAWARIEAALPMASRPRAADRPAARPARRAWRWAAVPALAVALGVWAWARPATQTAPAGPPAAVTLADGTTVLLRAGSTLAVERRLFGGDRVVRLDGEALFAVAADGSRFAVEAGPARVEVLGTRFSVRAWPDEGEATVALEEGIVRLVPRDDPDAAVELAPGDVARVGAEARRAAALDLDVATAGAWRDDAFVYKDRPLGEVLRDVARRYGVEVRAAPALGRRRVSVALREPTSAQDVLGDLSLALGLRFRPRADGFDVLPASAR